MRPPKRGRHERTRPGSRASVRSLSMPTFEAHVEISHLPGIADPQGATVERALPALGYTNVSEVHIGKTIRLVVESESEAKARTEIDDMCQRLLANPVIESYEITLREVERA